MALICVENFKSGEKDAKGVLVHFKKGEEYKGKLGEKLAKEGLVIDKKEWDAQLAAVAKSNLSKAELLQEIASLKSELAELKKPKAKKAVKE